MNKIVSINLYFLTIIHILTIIHPLTFLFFVYDSITSPSPTSFVGSWHPDPRLSHFRNNLEIFESPLRGVSTLGLDTPHPLPRRQRLPSHCSDQDIHDFLTSGLSRRRDLPWRRRDHFFTTTPTVTLDFGRPSSPLPRSEGDHRGPPSRIVSRLTILSLYQSLNVSIQTFPYQPRPSLMDILTGRMGKLISHRSG